MKERKKLIHNYSLGYSLLRAYVMFGLRYFYKRIQVVGRENIPYGSHFIINPNHQNALMDAMAVLFAVNKSRIVFMARADIFKSKRQEKILNYFKMLPIYRMRDGAQELSKNDEIFDRSVQIIADRIPLCLMPEGNHAGKRKLRNFVKGAFRIAFRSKEEVGEGEDVFILPVGIDYQNYQKFNQNLLIIIGKPVSVNKFMPSYIENQPKGLNTLRDTISDNIQDVMIHIENDELYDMYQNLRHIWNSRMKQISRMRGKTLHHAFRADKLMIRILDEAFETEPDNLRRLAATTRNYTDLLDSLNLRNWVIARKGLSYTEIISLFLRLLVTLPIALYGIVNNILPYYLPVRLTRKIKDPQFVSSFKFVLSILIFPIIYILQTVAVGLLSGSGLVAVLYLISLPISGYYSLYWSFWLKKFRAALKFQRLNSRKDPVIDETKELYVQIMRTMERICSDYLHKIPMKDKARYD